MFLNSFPWTHFNFTVRTISGSRSGKGRGRASAFLLINGCIHIFFVDLGEVGELRVLAHGPVDVILWVMICFGLALAINEYHHITLWESHATQILLDLSLLLLLCKHLCRAYRCWTTWLLTFVDFLPQLSQSLAYIGLPELVDVVIGFNILASSLEIGHLRGHHLEQVLDSLALLGDYPSVLLVHLRLILEGPSLGVLILCCDVTRRCFNVNNDDLVGIFEWSISLSGISRWSMVAPKVLCNCFARNAHTFYIVRSCGRSW